jgi:hypothetical protein
MSNPFHCQAKTLKRSEGRSAVAAAAYREGSKLKDERTGLVHDYTLKGRRNVLSSEILLPIGADLALSDSATLWNHAEKMERRKDSQVAREFEIALPADLPPHERHALAVRFGQYLVERYGIAAQVSVHLPGAGDNRNHHAHILTTTRDVINGKKITVLDSPLTSGREIEAIRATYAKMVNEALQAHGLEPTWDHRSNQRRSIDTAPSRHLGPASAAMARKGRAIDRRPKSNDEPPSAIALAIVCARPKTRAALTSARQEMRQARLDAFNAARRGSVPISSKTPTQTHPVPFEGHSHTARQTRAPFIINNRRGSDWRDDKDRNPDEIGREAFHAAMQFYYTMAEAIRMAQGIFDTAREDEVWTASKATAIASHTTDRNRNAVEDAWATSSGIWAAMTLEEGKTVPGAALRAMERSLEQTATVSETRRVKPPQCEPDGP